MTYSTSGYKERAVECARLASLTDDEMLRAELLKLRQTYLKIAERLAANGFEELPKAN